MTLHSVTLDDKYDLTPRTRVFVTGYQALIRALPDAEGARPPRRPQHRRLCHRLSRLAARRARPADPARRRVCSPARRHVQPASTRNLPPPRCGARSRRNCAARASSMACSASGTARAPASTAPATCSATPISPAPSKHGGVLALMGDDHTAESSTTAHQSEFDFVDMMIPILNPAGVQEIHRLRALRLGDVALHRRLDRAQMHARDGGVDRRGRRQPRPHQDRHAGRFRHAGGRAQHPPGRHASSARRRGCTTTSATPCSPSSTPTGSTGSITSGGRNPKIGIITLGKSYLDVRQALDELGIDEVKCNDLGIRIYKIGCAWPISREELAEFARGLDLIIVVEEKRSLIEVQVREELYGTANQPICIGKKDEEGNWLFPVKGALDPNDVAICIGERLLRFGHNDGDRRPRRAPEGGAAGARRDRRRRRSAFRISARAARTIPRPSCRRACAPMPASAATTWRSGWTARRSASPRWAARAPTGSARRRSPSARTCSRTSATAPTTIPAIWRSAPRSPPASTSPTRSCSTTRWR